MAGTTATRPGDGMEKVPQLNDLARLDQSITLNLDHFVSSIVFYMSKILD